jgi:hypothetical protein
VGIFSNLTNINAKLRPKAKIIGGPFDGKTGG